VSGGAAPRARDRRLGSLLVAAQLALLAWVAWRALPAFLGAGPDRAGGVAWLVLGAAVALAGWAVSANRPGNFNIHPEPKARGRLVRHGPYRWIRHPMYAALLIGAVATALACRRLDAWLATLALLLVLEVKARLEERWMAQVHPEYAAYRERTGRFLPRV
jgi:protein-S-isoprenylcysteine O-methyltransferase Ste14